jgi:alpha-L-fucosidase
VLIEHTHTHTHTHTHKMSMYKCVLLLVVLLGCVWCKRYTPDWPSLDSRELPTWYDESKFGVLMVYGVYSVPAVFSEWMWYSWKIGFPPATIAYMKKNYRPDFTYADFAKDFTSEFFNASVIEEIVRSSGAKFVTYVFIHTRTHSSILLFPIEAN